MIPILPPGALPILACALAGCVYVPVTATFYDADCRIEARKMHLELAQLASIDACQNQGCAAALAGLGAVAAASAVVSGSIVVAGNVVYWFEKQGQCAAGSTPEAPR